MSISNDKFFIARWIGTNPGGGVSIIGFVEYIDEVQKQPNGTIKVFRATKPTDVTIRPVPGEYGDVIKYNKVEIELDQGEFIVQNNEKNINKLKYHVRNGDVLMRDWDLQHEFLGEEAPEQIEEIIIPDEKKELDLTPKKSPAAKEIKKQEMLQRLADGRKAKKAEEQE